MVFVLPTLCVPKLCAEFFFQPLNDSVANFGNFIISQCTVWGLICKAVSQAFLAAANFFAAINIKERNVAQQLTSCLLNKVNYLLSWDFF
jgi:hypothetical protein